MAPRLCLDYLSSSLCWICPFCVSVLSLSVSLFVWLCLSVCVQTTGPQASAESVSSCLSVWLAQCLYVDGFSSLSFCSISLVLSVCMSVCLCLSLSLCLCNDDVFRLQVLKPVLNQSHPVLSVCASLSVCLSLCLCVCLCDYVSVSVFRLQVLKPLLNLSHPVLWYVLNIPVALPLSHSHNFVPINYYI